ncbi:MAG: hypothetical protein EXR77_01935 [Myxococcales bacterium]|nr:hypothetical protein [Myxococcales bacterium]
MGDKRRVYERPPSLVPAWVRAIASSGKKTPMDLSTVTFPRLEHELWPTRADPAVLARYRKLCGFVDSPYLPVTFPQLMAGALHVHMLTDPEFPLAAAGIVHMRNVIEQTRPIALDDAVHFACHLQPARPTDKGVEIDLVTQATVDSELVWSATITALARSPVKAAAKKSTAKVTDSTTNSGLGAESRRSTLIRVAEDTGRKYAAIAGDYNPIHLHATTAKLFGFPRAIVHGMWSLGRCIAECEDDLPAGPHRIDVQFRRPVFLPSTVVLESAHDDVGMRFALRSKDGQTLHMAGTVVAT